MGEARFHFQGEGGGDWGRTILWALVAAFVASDIVGVASSSGGIVAAKLSAAEAA